MAIAKSAQLAPTPAVPEQPAVTIPDPLPPPDRIFALTEMWKVRPTSPAPGTVDCVAGTSTAVMTSPALHPEHLNVWPGTNGRSPAAIPPLAVAVAPVHV